MAASRRAAISPGVKSALSETALRLSAAQIDYERRGGDPPAGPLYQWAARLDLDDLRERFEAGDRYVLMLAIRICANHDLAMPAWVSRAYIRAFDAVHNFRVVSWDKALGRPLKKGARLAALRKKRMKSVHVWNEVTRRRAAGEAIDDTLLGDVGKRLGLGLTLAWEYYNDWSRRFTSPKSKN